MSIFRGELLKLFARKRTYIGFGAFILVEMIILFLLNLPSVRKVIGKVLETAGYVAGDYLSGLTLAFLILLWSVFLLGSLYLALVAGDVVSKEVEDGTMRMMLCRPISRTRLLSIKVAAIVFYSLALTLFISATALGAGLLHSGPGGLFVFAPLEGVFAVYDFSQGLLRYAGGAVLLAISLLTISAIGFCLSCFDMKPATATITTLSILFVDMILKNIPFFEPLRDWFVTARMTAWVHVFAYHVPWEKILEDYAWLMGVNATLLIVAWVAFMRRDFKS